MLEGLYAEADTRYQFAAVKQQEDNAADVQKAKEEAREQLLLDREELEVKRGEAL